MTASRFCPACDAPRARCQCLTAAHRAEYEAVRMDPTTDRDRWDVWDDGGLEAPGEDEW